MNFEGLKKMAFALMSFAVLPVMGQDLIANQAPIDRRMRSVDSVALQKLIKADQYSVENSQLYSSWNNDNIRQYDAELPEEYRIDLRNYSMPTPSRIITSKFGARWGKVHEGLDIKVYIGDTIRSAFSGTVRIVKYNGNGYGYYVVVRHPNGLETLYGHLSAQLVKPNQTVRAGEPIGLGGNTGHSTGSHLHFETRLLGKPLNPALMFDFPDQDVTADFYVFHRDSYKQESLLANSSISRSDETNTELRAESSSDNQGVMSYHKVSRGETLASIAAKRHTTVDELCKLNGIDKKTKLHLGQIIRYS